MFQQELGRRDGLPEGVSICRSFRCGAAPIVPGDEFPDGTRPVRSGDPMPEVAEADERRGGRHRRRKVIVGRADHHGGGPASSHNRPYGNYWLRPRQRPPEPYAEVPVVQAMLTAYGGTPGAYVYGPVCVEEAERGRGLAGAM